MRQFVVSKAPVARVAQHVRDTVEDHGGIVANHTAHKTEFDHLDFGGQAWRRAGYVGTYQRFKEKPVQVRIRVWAQWPRRLLVASVYLGFAQAIVFFLISLMGLAIPPNVWIVSAIVTLSLIAISFLMYTSSISDSKGAEQQIEQLLLDRFEEDEAISGKVYEIDAWKAHREELIDEAREEAKGSLPHGGSRLRASTATLKQRITDKVSTDTDAEQPAEEEKAQASQATAGPAASTEESAVEGEEDEDDSRLASFVTAAKDRLVSVGSSEEDAEDDEAESEETGDPSHSEAASESLEHDPDEPHQEAAQAGNEEEGEEQSSGDEAPSRFAAAVGSVKQRLGVGEEATEGAEAEKDESGADGDEDETAEAEEATGGEPEAEDGAAKEGFPG